TASEATRRAEDILAAARAEAAAIVAASDDEVSARVAAGLAAFDGERAAFARQRDAVLDRIDALTAALGPRLVEAQQQLARIFELVASTRAEAIAGLRQDPPPEQPADQSPVQPDVS
ncbi:MAG: hypothetical protein QM572_06640, partial [Nocardioides sp.]|uniref:hypothetical protein n=1 Tax=Nocardioides sp. TaxID=35761 RepID=UPI0039E2B04B